MKQYIQPKAEVLFTFVEDVIRTSEPTPTAEVGDNMQGVLSDWEGI